MSILRYAVGAAALTFGTTASGGVLFEATGGQTSVALDFDAIEELAGLTFFDVQGPVIAPGSLPDSVAFPINSRDETTLPTSFAYDPADFSGTLAGTIEHKGSVRFNGGGIEVGDFTIGFDAGRVGGAASGFFVQDNIDLGIVLFDVELKSATPGASTFTAAGNLLVSPEFSTAIDMEGFDSGIVAGTALIEAVPGPGALAVFGVAGLAGMRRRR